MHSTASDAFINSCLATITHLIPVSAGVFYLVDRNLRPDHYILHGMPDKTHQQYLNHFQKIDPLQPANFHRQDITMVGMVLGGDRRQPPLLPRLYAAERHARHDGDFHPPA